jgi:UDP-GlcNAc:undecaprenyl-phosphate GlcNAc-1-phosphate transferase
MLYLWPFLGALALSAGLTPLIIRLARRFHFLAEPREDRWHKKPTALLGGIGIYLSFLVAFLVFIPQDRLATGLLVGTGFMFLVGLADDLFRLTPQLKLGSQIAAAVIAISFGISIKIVPFLAIPLTILWIVAITNAFNILDNIDGLASGIAFVAATNLFLYSVVNHFALTDRLSVILAGAALGFLIYNFHPAKIFMGDAGSLFLGYSFSLMTIIGPWKTVPNALVTLIVPLSILIIPIFDMSLVTFTRISRQQSVFQGGKDHSSHRLVFLGLSDTKAVLFLMIASFVVGASSLILARLSPLAAGIIILLITLIAVFFGVFLAGAKSGDRKLGGIYRNSPVLFHILLYKKQILQIVADVLLVVIAYVAAYLLRFEGVLVPENLSLIQKSLPVIILIKMAAFYLFRLYAGDWKYIGIHDLLNLLKAAVSSSAACVLVLVYVFRFEGYSRVVFILDFLLTVVLIGGFRVLMRLFREYFSSEKFKRRAEQGLPVLIFGAGDCGELAVREIKNNPRLRYRPVGFIDDDPAKRGALIHGISVLGSRQNIVELVKKHGVKKIFIAIISLDRSQFEDIVQTCRDLEIDCEFLKPFVE